MSDGFLCYVPYSSKKNGDGPNKVGASRGKGSPFIRAEWESFLSPFGSAEWRREPLCSAQLSGKGAPLPLG